MISRWSWKTHRSFTGICSRRGFWTLGSAHQCLRGRYIKPRCHVLRPGLGILLKASGSMWRPDRKDRWCVKGKLPEHPQPACSCHYDRRRQLRPWSGCSCPHYTSMSIGPNCCALTVFCPSAVLCCNVPKQPPKRLPDPMSTDIIASDCGSKIPPSSDDLTPPNYTRESERIRERDVEVS